jgi:hypothetical protein
VDRQGLRRRDIAEIVQGLAFRVMAISRHYGATYIQFNVPEGLASYAEVLENRGAVKCKLGMTYLKRISSEDSDGRQQHDDSHAS